jgi:hypothetical protein
VGAGAADKSPASAVALYPQRLYTTTGTRPLVNRDQIVEALHQLSDEARRIAAELDGGGRRQLVKELLDLIAETHRLAAAIALTDLLPVRG